ncbi:MAG: hypothetical protein ACRDRE_19930, partial [Pseudonocardiaceae bacterium]
MRTNRHDGQLVDEQERDVRAARTWQRHAELPESVNDLLPLTIPSSPALRRLVNALGDGYAQPHHGAAAGGAVGGELPAEEFGALLHAWQAVSRRPGSLGCAGRVEADTV